MTAGLWHQADEDLGEGAFEVRPAVSVAWTLGTGRENKALWLVMYDGPLGRKAALSAEGELGREAMARMADAISQANEYGATRVIIDFTRVDHIDYRTIPEFMDVLQRSGWGGMEFNLVGLNRYLNEIFRAAGVELNHAPEGDDDAACETATSAGKAPRIAFRGAPPRPVESMEAEDDE